MFDDLNKLYCKILLYKIGGFPHTNITPGHETSTQAKVDRFIESNRFPMFLTSPRI